MLLAGVENNAVLSPSPIQCHRLTWHVAGKLIHVRFGNNLTIKMYNRDSPDIPVKVKVKAPQSCPTF